eukprot:COSAG05_NODE_10431_length_566_cov_0.775161_1_plen_188_part_11
MPGRKDGFQSTYRSVSSLSPALTLPAVRRRTLERQTQKSRRTGMRSSLCGGGAALLFSFAGSAQMGPQLAQGRRHHRVETQGQAPGSHSALRGLLLSWLRSNTSDASAAARQSGRGYRRVNFASRRCSGREVEHDSAPWGRPPSSCTSLVSFFRPMLGSRRNAAFTTLPSCPVVFPVAKQGAPFCICP